MLPFTAPEPDVRGLKDILLRKTRGSRVHVLEHAIDTSIPASICNAFKVIGIAFVDQEYVREKKRRRSGTTSMTGRGMIESWNDFVRYPWPTPPWFAPSSIG